VHTGQDHSRITCTALARSVVRIVQAAGVSLKWGGLEIALEQENMRDQLIVRGNSVARERRGPYRDATR
jgi:hypothetical protein